MLTRISFALLFLGCALAGDMTISTPAALIQCQPVQLKWDGGQAPYFLAAIPGGQPSAPALKDFGEQTGTSLAWTVDLPAGTSVTLRLTDSAGTINYAQAVTIQPGSSTSCGGGSMAATAAPMMSGNGTADAASAMPSAMSNMSASSSMSAMTGSSMSMSGSSNMSSTSMHSSPTGMSVGGGSSMSRSSMSRSAVSSSPARPSTPASDDLDDSVGSNSDPSNDATPVQTIAKSGAIGFLVSAFALAWV